MGHRGHGRHGGWGGPDWRGSWGWAGSSGPGGSGGPGSRGHGGPPPWLGGLFGAGPVETASRGPKVRRGDVRSAILDVLATAERSGEPINGYQVIQQIAERSEGAWRPSPGSVYPTVQQLQDEGLVETDDERGRRALRLTQAGLAHVEEHADEFAAVWRPFEAARSTGTGDIEDGDPSETPDLKSEIGQVMPAVWQIVTSGSDPQRRAALEILAETRRKLYGVLAGGPDQLDEDPEDAEDTGS